MKRSCFALSILMASLSGSLLWGDAARSYNHGLSSRAAAGPRVAAPRPPQVDEDRIADSDSYDCPSRSECSDYRDFDCGYAPLSYDTCSYDARLHEGRGGPLNVHPSDLPEAVPGPETACPAADPAEIDSLYLSHYDAVYDAAVYGVDVYITEDVANEKTESPSPYAYETYDYEAYTYETYDDEAYIESHDPTYECDGYDYGYEDRVCGASPTGVCGASPTGVCGQTVANDNAQLYGHYYEYTYDYENDYDYEYDYDYQYEYDCWGDAVESVHVEDEPAPASESSAANSSQFRNVIAYLRNFIGDSLEGCEPIQSTVEAGCKIVAWSSGFDASLLWEAAGAEIADLPASESDNATR